MDWIALQSRMMRDGELSPRTNRLLALEAVLDGRQYDALPYPFSSERSPAGEYVPLSERRPSVRTGLCRVVVEDAVSLLFSEGHFPAIQADDALGARNADQGRAAQRDDARCGDARQHRFGRDPVPGF